MLERDIMVVLRPKICKNNDNYRQCMQVINKIYSLRYELVFAAQKQEMVTNRIKDLEEWKKTKLNNAKWKKIQEMITLTTKLQNQRSDVFKNITLSGEIRYKDALLVLREPEIQKEIVNKLNFEGFEKVSIQSIAALISKDGPKNLVEELIDQINKDNPTLALSKSIEKKKIGQ